MARKHQMTIEKLGGYQVINLGPMDIWDGADLALLRETLTGLIEGEGMTRVAVDMSNVKYVPSGYFGMLFDWAERGASICLDGPCERVRQMIWFRKFLAPLSDDRFRLETESLEPITAGGAEEMSWQDDSEDLRLIGTATDSGHLLGL
jgi:anti-anti-sigma regulatory factor